MRASTRPLLPLTPLLRIYLDASSDSGAVSPRNAAVRGVGRWLCSEDALDHASSEEYRAALLDLYRAAVPLPLHADTLARRAGLVRHAVAHLVRGDGPLGTKADRCLDADGPYFVAGLGPAFWSSLFQSLDPDAHPAWLPEITTGLRRLGLLRSGLLRYADLLTVYRRLRVLEPGLTADRIDHFLTLAGTMHGRDLWSGAALDLVAEMTVLLRQERSRVPLRQRLKKRGQAVTDARGRLVESLTAGDLNAVLTALSVAAEPLWPPAVDDARLLGALRELAAASAPFAGLEAFAEVIPLTPAVLAVAAAVLHLTVPRICPPWNETLVQALAVVDDALTAELPLLDRYRIAAEALTRLCDRCRMHPVEAPAVLSALKSPFSDVRGRTPGRRGSRLPTGDFVPFAGFCPDTFRFLNELARENRRDWLEQHRDRYRFVVREPLRELAVALARRYVEPVLCRLHGWDLETRPEDGRTLSRLTKNDFGRSVSYHSTLWVAFSRKVVGRKRDDVQFFVRLAADGVSYGLRLRRTARAAGRLLRRNVQAHAEPLFRALEASGALEACRFGHNDEPGVRLTDAGAMRAWAAGKDLIAARSQPSDSPMLMGDDLVGDILLTFDRLLPAYACAVEDDPLPLLTRRGGAEPRFAAADFHRATALPDDWLTTARGLLELKKQLILYGVPGTGKTHAARCLARLLTGDRPGAVSLVQFHPAYGYEEFVEGIKAKTVDVGGRHEVSYPVEDGLLCGLAAEAERRPAEPFVLVIDEINRGNLPRIFGELLYLLEYRGQTVTLPYSKRAFRLPPNLYLIGTMNPADRSTAPLDQALRRRFSFLEMPPDARLLAAWLSEHPPRGGEAFAARVVRLFEGLNDRLEADLGPGGRIGQSYFMVPGLDEAKLRTVWEHHVRPVLLDHLGGRSDRLAGYEFAALFEGRGKRARASGR